MNTREAMQALLDGKRLVNQNDKILSFDLRGRLVWEDGHPASLANHDWEIYEEPNPHPEGTFAWAREEAKRGRKLCRKNGSVYSDEILKLIRLGFAEPDREVWSLEDFDATDWEHA